MSLIMFGESIMHICTVKVMVNLRGNISHTILWSSSMKMNNQSSRVCISSCVEQSGKLHLKH